LTRSAWRWSKADRQLSGCGFQSGNFALFRLAQRFFGVEYLEESAQEVLVPFRIGLPELLVILGIAILVFGGRKIPELGKGLGEGIRNFKAALHGGDQKKPGQPS